MRMRSSIWRRADGGSDRISSPRWATAPRPSRRDAAMPQGDLAEPFFRVADGPRRQHDFVPHALETVGHDLEQQGLLAVEVVVQAGFRHAQGTGDVADRRRGEPAIPEDLGGGAADVDAPRRLRQDRHAGSESGHGLSLIPRSPGCRQRRRAPVPTDRSVAPEITAFVRYLTKDVLGDTEFWKSSQQSCRLMAFFDEIPPAPAA